ncbi:unnamed protein product, partial [marine sediment metagenome]
YHLLIQRCPRQPADCAQARISAGDCYARLIKDGTESAVREYAAVERDYPKDTKGVATAIQRLLDTWWKLKDYPKAAAVCQ